MKYEEALNYFNDGLDIQAMDFSDTSSRIYNELKELDKKQKSLELFNKSKERFKLPIHMVDIDIDKKIVTRLFDLKHKKRNLILKQENEVMFSILATGKGLFPDEEFLNKSSIKKNSLVDLFNHTYYDNNGNIHSNISSDLERKINKQRQAYLFHLQHFTSPLLFDIFIEGYVQEKINKITILDYFKNHSWIGQSFIKTIGDENYSWIDILIEPLELYFIELNKYLRYPNYQPKIITILDSLVLKFEGLFRSLCKLVGINTTIMTKGETQREAYITELLFSEEVIKNFDSSEITFYRFVYLKNGLNLRNEVAHSFLSLSSYNINNINLVLMTYLRIARYKLENKL